MRPGLVSSENAHNIYCVVTRLSVLRAIAAPPLLSRAIRGIILICLGAGCYRWARESPQRGWAALSAISYQFKMQSDSLCHQRCDVIIIGYRLHLINSMLTLLHINTATVTRDLIRSPVAIRESHLGSWGCSLMMVGQDCLKKTFSFCSLIHQLLFMASWCSAEVISSTQAWSLLYPPQSANSHGTFPFHLL